MRFLRRFLYRQGSPGRGTCTIMYADIVFLLSPVWAHSYQNCVCTPPRGPSARVCCADLGVLANRILGPTSLLSPGFTYTTWYVFVSTKLIETLRRVLLRTESTADEMRNRLTDRPLGLRIIQVDKTPRYCITNSAGRNFDEDVRCESY